ncbi:MAG TPA: MATE family efflux transporter, partial [Microbacterium sp.]|nr:MATE family efflux transporter [Microbacterium sp.]
CLEYLRRRLHELHVKRDDWRVTRTEIWEHLRLGLPMGFQASIIAIGTLAVQVALNEIGSEAVAAWTAGSRVDSLATALLASLGLATSMYVAQNVGAGRPDRIRRGVVQATWIAVIGSVLLGILLIVTGAAIVEVFVGDSAPRVVDLAHEMLIINASCYTILGVLFVLRGALQGLGHAMIPTVTGVIELVARVVAAVVLGSLWGFAGVAWSNPLAWLGAVVILIPAYVREHRRLARMPITSTVLTETTPIPLVGPTNSSLVVDAVVTSPITLPGAINAPRGRRGRLRGRRGNRGR